MKAGKIDKDTKELVLWRLDASVPNNFKLSMGDKGTFTKDELREHVKKEDDVGRIFVDMQLKFIKSLTSGDFSKVIAEQ